MSLTLLVRSILKKFLDFREWQSTTFYGPIVSTSSPTLTPFEDSDFLLEETDTFLAIEDEPISPEIDDSYYDSEGDILLLEEFIIMIHHHHLSLHKNLKLLNLKMKNLLLMNHRGLRIDKGKVDVLLSYLHPPPSKEFRVFLVTPGFIVDLFKISRK
ncbi:hypothetical protein Tco_0012796 [Tanacetum coccineum]